MRGAALALVAALAAGPALGHYGETHAVGPPAPAAAALAFSTATAFPSAIGGSYQLIDQTGAPRSQADPAGRPQLVFFGYAGCPGICSAVFPTLAALTDRLRAAGTPVTPILITVDQAIDTVESLGPAAARIHPDLVALTGSSEALAAARAAFQVEAKLLFVSPEHGPIYSHGSFVYLLDAQGAFLTLLPPILSPGRMAEIALTYLRAPE